jgi:xanthine/CO dehydrogenase XdhC/CoxF family maturation factor
MGSRRTHEDRLGRLRAIGLSEQPLTDIEGRIHPPERGNA